MAGRLMHVNDFIELGRVLQIASRELGLAPCAYRARRHGNALRHYPGATVIYVNREDPEWRDAMLRGTLIALRLDEGDPRRQALIDATLPLGPSRGRAAALAGDRSPEAAYQNAMIFGLTQETPDDDAC